MKGKELPCTQNTFAPKRVQCRILSKHKHFSSIGELGEGEYIEMVKQERQAALFKKNGAHSLADDLPKKSESSEHPSAPESLMPRCKKHNARHRRLWPFKSCKYDGEKITLVKIK